jgi:hypothetical protein
MRLESSGAGAPGGTRTVRRRVARRAGLGGLLGALLVTAVFGDEIMPTVTQVFFERGRRPVHQRVDFTVRCFGYDTRPAAPGQFKQLAPGSYQPVEVFSFSAKCPDYGCEIHEPFYLNYRHIDWCDMEGRAAGRPFKVARYGPMPIDFDKCKDVNPDLRRCQLRIQLPE